MLPKACSDSCSQGSSEVAWRFLGSFTSGALSGRLWLPSIEYVYRKAPLRTAAICMCVHIMYIYAHIYIYMFIYLFIYLCFLYEPPAVRTCKDHPAFVVFSGQATIPSMMLPHVPACWCLQDPAVPARGEEVFAWLTSRT